MIRCSRGGHFHVGYLFARVELNEISLQDNDNITCVIDLLREGRNINYICHKTFVTLFALRSKHFKRYVARNAAKRMANLTLASVNCHSTQSLFSVYSARGVVKTKLITCA